MAELVFNPDAFYRPRNEETYNGIGHGTELSRIPRSRASSYVSHNSLFPPEEHEGSSIATPTASTPSNSTAKLHAPSKIITQSLEWETIAPPSDGKKRRLGGWRFGVAVSAWTAGTVLTVNLLFIAIASAKFPAKGGIGTLFDGDCHYVETAATWLHVAINVLSSLLLSVSNYVMQAISSPTRKEVDRAHAKGDWVQIGVPSLRNVMGRVSWKRTIAWSILALSSVPIHLLYNSAIFKTISANMYRVTVVNEGFLDGQPFSGDFPGNMGASLSNSADLNDTSTYNDLRTIQRWFSEDQNQVVRLTNKECIEAYATQFVARYDNLLLITSKQGTQENETLLWTGAWGSFGSSNYDWICQRGLATRYRSCNVDFERKHASDWKVADADIDYCLAQATNAHCKLQYSQAILVTVILMNLCKTIVMLWTLYFQRDSTLVTFGDAVASFLNRPAISTASRCLMTRRDVGKGPLVWRQPGSNEPNTKPLPKAYDASARLRWFRAASGQRWFVALSLIATALAAVIGLLILAVESVTSFGVRNGAFALGLGVIDPRAMISTTLPQTGASGLVSAVLLANVPQTICSFLYLAYNGLFTCMCLAAEWSKYFLGAKPLRVSSPHGQQRSTYYLQLPFLYSLPLLAVSALLHWLISESIFLARVDYYKNGKNDATQSTSQTGFSPLAILLVLLVGIIMLFTLVGNGFRRFSSPMPVVGSCSVAIAAACHMPNDDTDAAYLPVAWGEVSFGDGNSVGHCSFTSHQVHDPVSGRLYAGYSSATDSPGKGRDDGAQRRRV